MTISSSDILTYIFTNRLSSEAETYLLQGNTAKGKDAVDAARDWLYSRFLNNGQNEVFEDFITTLYSLNSSALASKEDLRAALLASDSDNYLKYTMMFEAFIKYAMYELFLINDQELKASDKKEEAQEIIQSIIGMAAYPGADQSGANNSGFAAVVSVPTDTEIENEAFGLQAGWRWTNATDTEES